MAFFRFVSPFVPALVLAGSLGVTALIPASAQASTQTTAPVQNVTPTSSDVNAPKSVEDQDQSLKNEEKANKARAKADRAQRKALRAQQKADKATAKAGTTTQTQTPGTTPTPASMTPQ